MSPQTSTISAIEMAHDKLVDVRTEVSKFIFGQESVINQALTAILADGHILLIGMPGLAKTRLVTILSKTLGFDTKRIQCTPDLMPAEMIGSEVLEEVDYGRRNFRFIQGPIFCQFLMVDEINRASPRTQSALLQAMQERNITVSGREYTLPTPFHVLATQNPIEQEGTFQLPEAQLDRFLIQITIDYPSIEAERAMITASMKTEEEIPRSIIFVNDLREMQQIVRKMTMDETLLQMILRFIRSGRPGTSPIDLVNRYVSWGPGPRATQAMTSAMRAQALIQGRQTPVLDDFLALARPVLLHRMALNYQARTDGVTLEDIINAMLASATKGL
ncbi:MAG: MoxR family ATPase [Alphaproteobacteria bacterium]|nr:MoxR family ATPase [Alphaproteobacteria bacterium]